jgi:hypothetical protein
VVANFLQNVSHRIGAHKSQVIVVSGVVEWCDRLSNMKITENLCEETYAERMCAAANAMVRIAIAVSGDRFVGAALNRRAFTDEDGDESDLIVLSVHVNADAVVRADVEEALMDYVAQIPELEIRKGLSVYVY